MKFLHTMIRVNDLDESINSNCDVLGMKLLRKREYPSGKIYPGICRLRRRNQ